MKKIISMIIAVIVTAVALTGCNGSSTNSTSNSSSSSNTSSDNDPSGSSSGDSSNGSSSESSSSSSSSEDSSSSSSSESSSGDTSTESDSGNIPNEFGLPLPNTRSGEMAAKALAADEWGALMMLKSDEELSVLVSDKLSLDMMDDSCFITNMFSLHLYRIFLAKPKAGSESIVKSVFEETFDYLKNDPNVALYGGQRESVAGGVAGVTDDGYYYIIIHANGAKIADAMVK